jgi:hypothetical protein
MYWHDKDVQIAVFCDVIPHAVAGIYTFLGNALLPHSRSLTQTTPCRTPSCWRRGWRGVVRGLRAIKILTNFTEPSLPCSQDAD